MIYYYKDFHKARFFNPLDLPTKLVKERLSDLGKEKQELLNKLSNCGNIQQARRIKSAIAEIDRLIDANEMAKKGLLK